LSSTLAATILLGSCKGGKADPKKTMEMAQQQADTLFAKQRPDLISHFQDSTMKVCKDMKKSMKHKK